MKITSKFNPEIARANLGWIPDIPDLRDFRFGEHPLRLRFGEYPLRGRALRTLPTCVDLRPGCSPVEDQGDLGSCTANAIAGALEFLLPKPDASRLFIYFGERELEGTVRTDSGAYIRDGIKVVAKGYADESLWPYDIAKFKLRPSAAACADAKRRCAAEYCRCATLADVKAALASKRPVIFGFSVYEFALEADVARTGVIRMPTKSDRLAGGHAVLAVGYDDATGTLTFRNSWGPHWGFKGYGSLPYGYIQSRDLSDDFWVITKIKTIA